MKKMKLLLTAMILMLTLSACGNKKQQPTRKVWMKAVKKAVLFSPRDTLLDLSEYKTGASSTPSSPASSSTHSYSSGSRDNMRGFDPASEDDMNDNGMSRYMDNYDDEGWE